MGSKRSPGPLSHQTPEQRNHTGNEWSRPHGPTGSQADKLPSRALPKYLTHITTYIINGCIKPLKKFLTEVTLPKGNGLAIIPPAFQYRTDKLFYASLQQIMPITSRIWPSFQTSKGNRTLPYLLTPPLTFQKFQICKSRNALIKMELKKQNIPFPSFSQCWGVIRTHRNRVWKPLPKKRTSLWVASSFSSLQDSPTNSRAWISALRQNYWVFHSLM